MIQSTLYHIGEDGLVLSYILFPFLYLSDKIVFDMILPPIINIYNNQRTEMINIRDITKD
nr:MAG TPA: hypothetical protein [Caudoviricetes sp.]